MPVAWVAKMRKDEPPQFPPICIGCGGKPTTTIQIAEDAIGWWSLIRFGWLYGMLTGKGIAVPACAPCARHLRRDRIKRSILEWTFILTGLFVGFWLFDGWTGWAHRIAVIGLGVVVCAPYFLWTTFHPPAVEITVTENTVTYHFADQSYAERFAEDNPTF
jgi:hypothetical protein